MKFLSQVQDEMKTAFFNWSQVGDDVFIAVQNIKLSWSKNAMSNATFLNVVIVLYLRLKLSSMSKKVSFQHQFLIFLDTVENKLISNVSIHR